MTRDDATAFVVTLFGRLRPPSEGTMVGSAESSVALSEIARLSTEESLQRLGTSENGLTPEAAVVRLRLVGPNEIAREAHNTVLGEILRRSSFTSSKPPMFPSSRAVPAPQ